MNNQENNTHFVDFFINRLKSATEKSTNKDLAIFLGVSEQTLSNWISRKSINFSKVLTICVDKGINLNYLFTGNGSKNLEQNINQLKNNLEMDCNNCPYKEMYQKLLKDSKWYQDKIDTLEDELRSLRHQDNRSSKRESA